jgi:hypothetical protein
MSGLASALAALQADPPKIKRTTRGQHNKYAPLDVVMAALRPWMAEYNVVWSCKPTLSLNGEFVLSYSLSLATGDEFVAGEYPLGEGSPQAMGSAITYARRYALLAVTGLAPEGEDDDGMAASQGPQRTRTKIPGPDHERLRNGTVEATPDDRRAERGPADDDPWQDQPPGQLPVDPEHRGGSIDGKQRSRIMRHLGKLTHEQRAGRLRNIVGRDDIDGTNDLSWAEAAEVIKILEES